MSLVVLDFRNVKNIDASGAVGLQQIGDRLARPDKRLFLSGLSELQALRAGAPANIALNTFADMDDALEQAEEDIIERMSTEAISEPDRQLETSDFGLTMESEYLAVLMSHMQSLMFAKGRCCAGPAIRPIVFGC